MIRDVIEIDEEKCTGCGLCIPGCPEGALQVIDEKARLVADYLCDGLGACVGECPEDAMKIVQKEVGEYDERKVMKNIVLQGENTIKAHIKHLRDHGQTEFLKTAMEVLKEKDITLKEDDPGASDRQTHAGCPGAKTMDFSDIKQAPSGPAGKQPSELRQWPIQLHLISPAAPYFSGADLLLAADCTAFAMGNFHNDFLKGKTLIIACPKLDSNMDVYLAKLEVLIDEAGINTLTVLRMQVPCCGGLTGLAKKAADKAKRKVPIKDIVVSVKGEVLSEEWL
jgi:NAD-dependent dihydropyrimidine dehydrogenase PreA subunit